jgi:uncharacterized YigZ family protein
MAGYTTIFRQAQDEFVEKKSRFIGTIRPVQSEEEAVALITEMRETYWDATHNVYAYVLREPQIKRYSDDGEPQGTAGIPVLEVLEREGLTNVVCVVTRYFGGTLLGAGGLVRAYTKSAKLAVDAAQRKKMEDCAEIRLVFPYPYYGKISYLLPEFGAVTKSSSFAEDICLTLWIQEEQLQSFQAVLEEATGGTVRPDVLRTMCACLESEK